MILIYSINFVTKSNIIGLDINSNLNINSALGDIFLNSNNTGSELFINFNNSKNVLVSSKLAVGINSTSNINANLTVVKNGFIGINTTQGSNDSYLGLSGSSFLSNTTGSRILLYGNDNTNGNNGNLNLYAGNSSTGKFNVFTGDDSNAFQILKTGTSNFSPNGSTIRLSISDTKSLFTNQVQFTNTNISTSATTGSVLVNGGLGIVGDTFIEGTLNINSIPYVGSQWTTSGSTLYYGSGGNTLVGINTTNPTSTLTVNGDLNVNGNITLANLSMTNLSITNLSVGNLYTNTLSVNNTSYVFAGSCSAGNNIVTETDLLGLILPTDMTRSFTVIISVSTIVSSGSNFFTQYTAEGIQTDYGWVIYDYSIGDIPNITFSINSFGQLQYTSTDVSNWTSTTLRYQATGLHI